MLKWLVLVLILIAVAAGVVFAIGKAGKTVVVKSPVDRFYAFPLRFTRAGGFGSHIGTAAEPVTGRGRTRDGNKHLMMGTHRFNYPIKVAECTVGQYAITFWSHDTVGWKASAGPPTSGAVEFTTADGISGTVDLRVSYSIKDEYDALINIMKPEIFAERAISDTLDAVRDYVSEQGYIDLMTCRKEMKEHVWDDLKSRLDKRKLNLRDLWIGHIAIDPEVQQAFHAFEQARTNAKTQYVEATTRSLVYKTLAESVDSRLLALIRAEKSGPMPFSAWSMLTPPPGADEGPPPLLGR